MALLKFNSMGYHKTFEAIYFP